MTAIFFCNLPVFPIKPQYIFSSDDTVVYTYEGKGKESDVFRLVARKALNVAGTVLVERKSMI